MISSTVSLAEWNAWIALLQGNVMVMSPVVLFAQLIPRLALMDGKKEGKLMIELPQLREPGRVSDIAGVNIYCTPWGLVNDEARIEILTYDHNTGASNITESGALGLNELLQIARDALLLAGKDTMAKSLSKEIRQRRAWSQIAEKHLKEGNNGG